MIRSLVVEIGLILVFWDEMIYPFPTSMVKPLVFEMDR